MDFKSMGIGFFVGAIITGACMYFFWISGLGKYKTYVLDSIKVTNEKATIKDIDDIMEKFYKDREEAKKKENKG